VILIAELCLQLAKYSHEKQIRELECKLQLQTSSVASKLAHMSELDSTCKAFCRDVAQVNAETERLDANGPYTDFIIDLCEPSRCLRSTNCHILAVPSCAKSPFASRAFCVSSPNNWNSLSLHIRSSDSLVTFQSRLKSHLFSSAYHV